MRVGDDRGVVLGVGPHDDRFIITAAHCLPLPPAHGMSYLEERTYRDLLGPLDSELSVWTQCLFADPVGDIAILASPDNQELYAQAPFRR
jgi:hypothetical protein